MVRLKHRYLLVNILYPSPTTLSSSSSAVPDIVTFHQPSSDRLTTGFLLKVLRDSIVEQFGDYGAVKYLSPATSTAIIRVSRDHYRLVWGALTLLTRLPHPIDQECVIQVVRVSGTIRKAEEEAIRRAKQAILRARCVADGAPAEGLDTPFTKGILEHEDSEGRPA